MSADSISTEELRALLIAGQPVTVVDIREPAERDWSIPGSLIVDAHDAVNSGILGPLADLDFGGGPVVTVCGAGKTAALRAGQLHHSLERLLQLSAATLVLPGHVSDPIAFDRKRGSR